MFYEKLDALCTARGISPTAACKAIGISGTNASYWRRGSYPNNSTVRRFAEYFGVPVTYFTANGNAEQTVTGNNNIAINGDNNTIGAQNEMEKALLSLFRSLSPIEQAYEITRLDGLVNKK